MVRTFFMEKLFAHARPFGQLVERSGRLALITFLFFYSAAAAQKAIPELWGTRVHDEAHALKPETVDALEKQLKVYEDSTSNQIAILIVPSLDGEVLESYSLKVAEKWKLGQKGKDNGVLLLVAVEDHKMRIEVGQGLEGVLTDAQSNRIIRNEIAPEFRRGDYDAGIIAGIDGITKAIKGEYQADSSDASNEMSLGDKFLFGGFIFFMLALFTFAAIFSQGGAGWGLYAFLIPFYALFPWIIIGVTGTAILLGIYLITVPVAKLYVSRSAWGKALLDKWKKNASSRSSGGWSSGWSSGGSSWSSSDSGSSFSGGGGSFGGGGSSGGW